eukprot:Blabericola_migrator_1__10292@NODE_577_length_7504_cov_115_679710_g61_i1_p3_GENE_NODE_577_length_7504_cov_115_679710_g61_i1NODE_577_length_7504_cov_115_679710_g61_i1_p3_ORF_typecomplete_len306_score32_34_NODE_577_length_7504_cov_115_679710_g61_i124333350
MIDSVRGYACWLSQDGKRMEEYCKEAILEASPPISTRVKAVSTSRLSCGCQSCVSTATPGTVSSLSPHTPFTSPEFSLGSPAVTATSSPPLAQPTLPIMRCYVQATPLSQFVVHFEETAEAPSHAIAVEVLVDGQFVRGRFVRRGGEKAIFNISRRSREGSSATTPLEFPDFQDVEDPLDSADYPTQLGTICVDVWKGRSRSTLSDSMCKLMTTADAEDVLTPRPLRRYPPVFLRGGTAFDPLMNFEFEERLVRFEFRYRTPNYLSRSKLKSKQDIHQEAPAGSQKKKPPQNRPYSRPIPLAKTP